MLLNTMFVSLYGENHERIETQGITRDATRCNNRDDLLHVNFTLKISIFSETYI